MIFVYRQNKTRLKRETWGFRFYTDAQDTGGKLILERFTREVRTTRAWPWYVEAAYSRYNVEGYSAEVLNLDEHDVPIPTSINAEARRKFAAALTVCKASPFRPGDVLKKKGQP